MMINKGKLWMVLPILAGTFFCFDKLPAQPADARASWRGPQSLETLHSAPVPLIPFPQQVTWRKGRYLINAASIVYYIRKDSAAVSGALRSLRTQLPAGDIVVRSLPSDNMNRTTKRNGIVLLIDSNMHLKHEGYTLQVHEQWVTITGKDAAGLYYGVQTFHQLMQHTGNIHYLPACMITDWPAFAVRGFMHDNGRNFQEISSLKKQLDRLSAYKFNTFHWHLTDNPAWRPQSKIYPQLNEARYRKGGRDPEKSYSFDDIRELVRYAKKRAITIIPELDMPGHSAYFQRTFGFRMESEQGMQVLEKLIDEFCNELPVADCPVIHIGSDEVHVPNPTAFIARMAARVKANGRKVMVWNPGLPPEKGTIEQVWRDDLTSGSLRRDDNPYVDSYAGYLNSYDALSLVQRYFFQQVCNKEQGDAVALGGILCCWPDTKVDDKRKIFLHNPVWPGALAYSEAVWCGRPQPGEHYMAALPAATSTAGQYFHEFEMRLASHRDRFFTGEPFPYARFGNIEWEMTGPYYRSSQQEPSTAFAPEKSDGGVDTVKVRKITGGVVRMEGWLDRSIITGGHANETVYLKMYINSSEAKTIHVMTGFEAAVRSNRRSAGIPANGRWDANGGAIFVNGKELPGPQWQHPGGYRYLKPTWETPANEIPFTDEEFYWSRPPATIKLKKGSNTILVRVPRTYPDQAWMFAFVPVRMNAAGRWVEDGSVLK
ncbi:beta-N-acetylhexosaminidase [Asinibacterium sp. OR53]|uniref:beta-N-acetylhexosaminidase n=1 Tax=Asinibacterium sp. OR53 TaxID=925409 RepID=UPI00047E8A3E|nr:beta-N-acetylhexosaminidase [Asinibacterium sp. OR53]